MGDTSWGLPAERVGREAPPDLAARRAGMAQMPVPEPAAGVRRHEATHGGVVCLVAEPEAGTAPATILHLHGGGFRLGARTGWAAYADRLVGATGCRVVVPDYRLAPEHPFPAALVDALAVHTALHAALGAAHPVVISGDSAGGGLAVSLVAACLRAGAPAPAPAALIAISPWVDLRVVAGTYEANAASDQLFSRASATDAAEQYLQGHPADDAMASPLLARLDGAPPALVITGGAEVLLDDALALAAVLARADVPVELLVGSAMQHVYPTLFPDLPESQLALARMADLVARVAVGTGRPGEGRTA